MAITAIKPRLAPLSNAERYRLRKVAFWWMAGVTLFNGVNLALKKPTLDAYPGSNGDPVMRVIVFVAITGCLATLLKVPAVVMMGPWLERKLRGNARTVRLRDVWHPGIRAAAFWGGSLQCLYQIVLVSLVIKLSPAGISAAKACVVIPLVFLEIYYRQMKPDGRAWWWRLVASIALTLTGAGVVVFEGGFQLFKDDALWGLGALLFLMFIGNGLLAYAEVQETAGVHDDVAAAPVYSQSRLMVYSISCIAAAVGWLAIQTVRGKAGPAWDTIFGVAHMCYDRWELVVPIALLGAICDTSRMCVKTLITATYMYVMLAMAVVIDIALQIPLKGLWPDVYDNVHPGWGTVVRATAGALLLGIGIYLHPRPTKKDVEREAKAAPV